MKKLFVAVMLIASLAVPASAIETLYVCTKIPRYVFKDHVRYAIPPDMCGIVYIMKPTGYMYVVWDRGYAMENSYLRGEAMIPEENVHLSQVYMGGMGY